MKSEDQKLIDQLLNPQQGSLDEEYQQELSYRFAQEARLRIQKQFGSIRKFSEEKNLDAPQISRQLSGTYNLTLKSIARIAAALEEPLMNVCGRPSYRFEAAHMPLYAYSAKEGRMIGGDPLGYSHVKHVINILPIGEEKSEVLFGIKSESSKFISFNKKSIKGIEYQKFEEVENEQMNYHEGGI